MHLALGHPDEGGDVAPEVEEGVELDRRFRGSKVCPGKERQTEVNRRRIQCVDGLLEVHAEALVAVELPRLADQHLRELGVDPPVASLIGHGQRGARDRRPDAHVVELLGTCAQAGFNVAQALSIAELRERHHQKVIPTPEVADALVSAVPLHAALKRAMRRPPHDLCKERLPMVHRPLPCLRSRESAGCRRSAQIVSPIGTA